MDEEKPNPLADHRKLPEEAVVHHAVVMEIEEADMQDAHSHTHELMSIPNLKEDVIVHDADAIVDIIDESAQDTIMKEEMEEVEDDIEQPLLLPMNAMVQQLRPLHKDLPRNTNITTTAPQATKDEEDVSHSNGIFNDEDEHYVDYISIMVQKERNDRTVPLETRTQAPANDLDNATRQDLFTSTDSQDIYPSMDEGDNNGSYKSIIYDAQKMENMVDPGTDKIPPPLQLSRSKVPKEELGDHHPSREEDDPELSLQYIKKN